MIYHCQKAQANTQGDANEIQSTIVERVGKMSRCIEQRIEVVRKCF